MSDAKRQGRIEIEGSPRLVRGFAHWFRPSPFAVIEQHPGRHDRFTR